MKQLSNRVYITVFYSVKSTQDSVHSLTPKIGKRFIIVLAVFLLPFKPTIYGQLCLYSDHHRKLEIDLIKKHLDILVGLLFCLKFEDSK